MTQNTQEYTETVLSHGGGGPELFGEDGANPRCLWDETVCTEMPTHHITHPAVGEQPAEAQTFCMRHYVLTLAEYLEVHSTQCSGTVDNHFAAYGAME